MFSFYYELFYVQMQMTLKPHTMPIGLSHPISYVYPLPKAQLTYYYKIGISLGDSQLLLQTDPSARIISK